MRVVFVVLAFVIATSAALSQSLPLSGLNAGSAVSGTDLFYDVQTVGTGGVKVTASQVKTFMSASPTFTGTVTFPDNTTWTTAGASGITINNVSSTTQCLHVVNKAITGTGADCTATQVAGTTGQVQFNNGSAFSADSSFTFTTPGQATLALGTITANAKALNITGTWNNAGTTFDAPLFVNIITTAFSTPSLLADLQVSSIKKFTVDQNGAIKLNNGVGSIDYGVTEPGRFGVVNSSSLGFAVMVLQNLNAAGYSAMDLADTATVIQAGMGFANASVTNPDLGGGAYIWSNTNIPINLSPGAFIANISRGSSGTGLRVYNTINSTSNPINFERGIADWTTGSSTNYFSIGTQSAGTGLGRVVALIASNTIAMSLSPTINLYGQSNPGANETYAVCAGSGATSLTSGGQLFVDTTTCLASSMLVKHDIAAFNDYGMIKLASLAFPLEAGNRLAHEPIDIDPIAEAMALIPVVATYDNIDRNPQFTLIAQNACQVDERLCERTKDGSARSFRPNAVISILVAALQKQQKEIEGLKSQINSRH